MASEDDTAYKQLFAHPEMVRDLLLGFVPATWVRQLDLESFERVSGSYIGDGGQHRHSDMVWKVRLSGQWIYVYLLLEFQSRSDPWMALRMQVDVGLLYQDLVKRHELPQPLQLPPVFPVLLYNGKRPWSACPIICGGQVCHSDTDSTAYAWGRVRMTDMTPIASGNKQVGQGQGPGCVEMVDPPPEAGLDLFAGGQLEQVDVVFA